MKTILSFLCVLLSTGLSFEQSNNWSDVENVLGKKGSVQDGVFKITFPRSDLNVKVGDFSVAPGLALTSWIGFIKSSNDGMNMEGNTMMMGDIVMLDSEVTPVIAKLVSLNLEVTALHNHLVGETPAIKYAHFSGNGDAVKLAKAIKTVLSLTATPFTTSTPASQTAQPDWSKVEAILSTSGKHNGNLLQYSFPRLEMLTEDGMEMPAYMGMATGVNFQLDGNRAAIAGDFVLLADEVNPVLKALTENGIAVTAIHNHMLYDNPRLFMMHFWAVGDPEKLAKGINAALHKTNTKR